MSIPKNPHPKTHRGRFVGQGMIDNPEYRAWQECAAAIVKWLEEPCKIHVAWNMEFIESLHFLGEEDDLPYWLHRKDCPKCLQELKESVK